MAGKQSLAFSNSMLPIWLTLTHTHLFCFFIPYFHFVSWFVLSRVCVLFTSYWSEALVCLRHGATDIQHSPVTEQGLGLCFLFQNKSVTNREKLTKSYHPCAMTQGPTKNCNVHCCTIFSNKRTQKMFVLFMWKHSCVGFVLGRRPTSSNSCHLLSSLSLLLHSLPCCENPHKLFSLTIHFLFFLPSIPTQTRDYCTVGFPQQDRTSCLVQSTVVLQKKTLFVTIL